MSETYTISGSGASAKATITMDPDAVLDYTFDWTEYLDDISDSIISKTVVAATGLTVNSSSISGDNKKVIVWVAASVTSGTLQLTCRIVTAGGRTDDRSIFIKLKER